MIQHLLNKFKSIDYSYLPDYPIDIFAVTENNAGIMIKSPIISNYSSKTQELTIEVLRYFTAYKTISRQKMIIQPYEVVSPESLYNLILFGNSANPDRIILKFSETLEVNEYIYITISGVKFSNLLTDINLVAINQPVMDIFNDNSCIMLLRFEKTAEDAGGNYNGVWSGNEQYEFRNVGFGAKFDGNSYITLPDISSVVNRNNPFTFSGWIRWDGFNDWSRIFDINGTYISNPANSSDMHFCVRESNGTNALNAIMDTIVLDELFHLTITLDTNEAKYYKNGVYVSTLDLSVDTSTTDTLNSYIGKSNWINDSLFEGFMDNIRIFNKPLTDDEIQYLYTIEKE